MSTNKDIKYGISTGLPDSPPGLPDEQYALVAPLYRGLLSLAQQLSNLLGKTNYSKDALQHLGIAEIDTSTDNRYKVVQADDAIS